ncbi:hypothetical protein IF1G_04904 [Cordyceps javanica]|uniref:Uncharacterized protein n=1 Tax=Cordyceps javanica TaxID=43265 RepID=A0A545V3N5_9HYPO|nr:hypothetical protein IF1G_04904 [Cordyceps javanica]
MSLAQCNVSVVTSRQNVRVRSRPFYVESKDFIFNKINILRNVILLPPLPLPCIWTPQCTLVPA